MSELAKKAMYDLLGVELKHLESGRPFFSELFDVSVSHKDVLTEIKIVPASLRIGIDIENLAADINARSFLGPVITESEIYFMDKLRAENNFSLESAVAVFWSIKESFFKCLDYDLKPGKIMITDLSEDGEVALFIQKEIAAVMNARRLQLRLVNFKIKKGYVYAETMMEVV